MRLLLDTHVVLWQEFATRKLGPRARAAMAAADEIALSVVSFVEVGIKVAAGKLEVPGDFEARVRRDGLRVLGVTPEDGLALGQLPRHHRDPFDRLLAAQALHGDWTLVTVDRVFAAYGVRTVDPLV